MPETLMGRTHPRSQTVTAFLSTCLVLASCTTRTETTLIDQPAAPAIEMAGGVGPTVSEGASVAEADVAAPSKPGSPLSLEAAVRKAVSWHPSVDQAVARLNESDQNIKVARAGYYPKLHGGLNSNYDSSSADTDGWRPKMEVSASQMIYDFGKVSSSVDAGIAAANVSRAQLLLAVDNLIRDTAYAVIEIQRGRALLAVAREQLTSVRAIARLVEQRSDKGASTRSDKVQAQARVEAAQSTILQISSELSRWESSLASLIGSSASVPLSPDVPAWLSKSCDVGAPDWSDVPTVMEAVSQKKKAQAQLRQVRAQRLPTLSLDAGASYDINQSRSGNLDYDPRRPQFTVGLNVSSSIYDAATAPRNDAAGYALRAADAAESNARYEVARSLSEARSQTAGLKRLQGSLSSRVGMMRQTRDLYRQQYVELGTRTLLDLLNAEQELHSAQFDIVTTRHDLRRLDIDCLFNSGLTRDSFALSGTMLRGVSL